MVVVFVFFVLKKDKLPSQTRLIFEPSSREDFSEFAKYVNGPDRSESQTVLYGRNSEDSALARAYEQVVSETLKQRSADKRIGFHSLETPKNDENEKEDSPEIEYGTTPSHLKNNNINHNNNETTSNGLKNEEDKTSSKPIDKNTNNTDNINASNNSTNINVNVTIPSTILATQNSTSPLANMQGLTPDGAPIDPNGESSESETDDDDTTEAETEDEFNANVNESVNLNSSANENKQDTKQKRNNTKKKRQINKMSDIKEGDNESEKEQMEIVNVPPAAPMMLQQSTGTELVFDEAPTDPMLIKFSRDELGGRYKYVKFLGSGRFVIIVFVS